jgi:hypothetical protein
MNTVREYQIHEATFKRVSTSWSSYDKIKATRILATRVTFIPALNGDNEIWCKMEFLNRIQNRHQGEDITHIPPHAPMPDHATVLQTLRWKNCAIDAKPYYWCTENPIILFKYSTSGSTSIKIFRIGTPHQVIWFKNNYFHVDMNSKRMDKYIAKRLKANHKYGTIA